MGFIDDMFNLTGKVAVLTGGGGILAGSMAEGFARAGVKVVLLDLYLEKAQQKAAALRDAGYAAEGFQCNVLSEENLMQVRDRLLDTYGAVDILVNAAGGNMPAATVKPDGTIFDLNMKDLQKVTDLNFNGTVLPTLILGKPMAERNSGSIINISSMASLRVISRVVGYAAAKAAVDNFTRWMAVELAVKFGDGIRVNAIAPGFLLTEQNRTLLTNEDGSFTERGRDVIRGTPFRRMGDPQELVGTVLWLASDASRFVTGTVVPVDGGFSVATGV